MKKTATTLNHLCLSALGVICLLAGCTRGQSPGLSEEIESGGIKRTYVIYAPASANRSKPLPLVIVLHGGGGHTWPGGLQYLGENLIGRTSRDLNASSVILNFFFRHARKP